MNKTLGSILVACLLLLGLLCPATGADAAAVTKPLPNVKILATGGTIAGAGTSSTQTVGYTAAVTAVDSLISAVPELKNIANVSGEQVAQIASEDMTDEVWLKLAKRVNQLLASPLVDGIVITHGTDTLEETAYFLNLVVKSDKPVVVVGSMRPATSISADGPMNLYRAVILAGSAEAAGKGVLVMLNDQINAAREVSKTDTASLDTFKSPGLGLLGTIQNEQVAFYRQPTRRHTSASEFDVQDLTMLPRVDIVYGYANNSRSLLDAAVKAGAKGIVHAGTGNGSIHANLKPAIEAARSHGVVFVRSSRVGSGIVSRGGEFDDDRFGTVAGDNLNPQKARILLMLALTRTSDPAEIQQLFWKY